MDEKAQKQLNDILAKDHNDLTPNDKKFLQARAPYISREDKKRLGNILKEEIVIEKPAEEVKREDWSDHPADQKEEVTESVPLDEEEDEDEE